MGANQQVAVVGLGTMGHAIAVHLIAQGWRVSGWDADAKARAASAQAGIGVATGLPELLQACDFVLTSLPNNSAVKEVWLGSEGIVVHARPGTVCIEVSTIDPQLMVDIAGAASSKGLLPLDCPVSGGPYEARAGQLVIMVGGEAGAADLAADVLSAMGSKIVRTGAVGTAKTTKLVNNMMAMGNLLIACEAFALGEAAGVDSKTLFEVLSVSGGRSQTFQKRFPYALENDYSPRFKLKLAEKDLGLGLDFAQTRNVVLPTVENVRRRFSQAMLEGYGEQDAVAMLAMYRKLAGIACAASGVEDSL